MDGVQKQESNGKQNASATIGFDDDDSGSDVSVSPSDVESSSYAVSKSPIGPEYESSSALDTKSLPHSESLNTIKQRLEELDAVEDALNARRDKLIAKRHRKDERVKSRLNEEDARIKKQRDEEDARIQRQRDEEDARRAQKCAAKEDRIRNRREREDADCRKKEKAHDDEEAELRRKLKNLKRRRPVDDGIAEPRRGSTISESMSPPAKKHQPNPVPTQPSNVSSTSEMLQPLLPQQQSQQQHQQHQQHQHQQHQQHQHQQHQHQHQHQHQQQQLPPRYPVYYGWNPPPSGPYAYGPGETYQPQNQASPPQQNALPPPQLQNGGPPRFTPLSQPSRNGPSPQATPPPSHTQSPRHQAQAHLAPSGPSHYDVRPPPAASKFPSTNAAPSGFTSINQPPPPPPPPHGMRTPVQPASKAKRSQQSSAKGQAPTLESAVHHSPKQPSGSSPTTSTPIPIGKRKASTTHPYSQSEAFANRHHHCERTDELDRGIWTYFGPGGTKEAPTVAGKKEMYLRCNHDGCMRIDWKTVHGLQCHIVKNHGIPKGTIGSLELALEKYGIEVDEIEGHEKEHGPGSAGTMAEKGTRGRPRSRPSHEIVMLPASGPSAGATTGPASAPPAKSTPSARSKPSVPVVLFPNLTARSPSGGYMQDDIVYSEDESDGDDSSTEFKRPAARKDGGSAHWKASDSDLSTPPISRPNDDGDHHDQVPRSVPAPQTNLQKDDGLKSLQPRPTSSTKTLAITDIAPKSTSDTYSPLSPPSTTSLPLLSITQTQAPPMGTETQKIVSAINKVNTRLEAQDPDFVAATPSADSDVPPQTQTQTQTQSQDPATIVPSTGTTKNLSSSTSSSSRPRGGADRRVRASERWGWAPISSDEDNDHHDGGGSGSTGAKKRSAMTSGLTKAQQELQGIDGADDGSEGLSRDAGVDGGGESGGGSVSAVGNGHGTGNSNPRSPMTARHSARTKKTRRRVD
jgi:hypothetical protein